MRCMAFSGDKRSDLFGQGPWHSRLALSKGCASAAVPRSPDEPQPSFSSAFNPAFCCRPSEGAAVHHLPPEQLEQPLLRPAAAAERRRRGHWGLRGGGGGRHRGRREPLLRDQDHPLGEVREAGAVVALGAGLAEGHVVGEGREGGRGGGDEAVALLHGVGDFEVLADPVHNFAHRPPPRHKHFLVLDPETSREICGELHAVIHMDVLGAHVRSPRACVQ
mmetsp:Transcript_79231/g.132302  ORF Transcript_79231/g.132302 Transcript_79231/m.132302 type:complete len:220 (+) Transcript_79231:1575-2234(+)